MDLRRNKERGLKLDRRHLFLLLVTSQLLHSIEEVHYDLWAVFAPARFLSGLISSNLEYGFILGNIAVVCLGFACAILVFKSEARQWNWIVFSWVTIETINFCVHTFMAILTWGYFPGVFIAPFLLLFSVLLILEHFKNNNDYEKV